MITNPKFFSVSYGVANEGQVFPIIKDLIDQGSQLLGTNVNYDLFLHAPYGNIKYGNGYLWVDNPKISTIIDSLKPKTYELEEKQIEILNRLVPFTPKYGTVVIKRANCFLDNLDLYYYDRIFATGVPEWLGESDILDVVKKYSDNPMYPLVHIENSTVSIRFDPKSNNALFAMLMTQGRAFGKEQTVNLFFMRELTRYGINALKKSGEKARKILADRVIQPYLEFDYLVK